ncbi:hypothetical protein Patl1_31170 [Pistacia atlantica]|uniref:Uncharacterized protein n=1 Tax=Pistacia atlantica TaxID=434234 RepID=A0ACC1A895_9ROSI|nr:hypothetical protein Patl1_31170 [Pistacia atlantica]
MPGSWDARLMFELYLFDYLRKNNMHQTAEIFFREANLSFDPSIPTSIDVPDGFLHEWWSFFFDMFTSRQLTNCGSEESPSNMVEQTMEAMQQLDPSPSRQYVMNEQTISCLLAGADSWFNTGDNAIEPMRFPLIGAEQIPLGISSSLHQQDILASTSLSNLPGNLPNLTAQEVGCSVVAAARKANIPSEERGKDSMNTSDSINGNTSLLVEAGNTSEGSLTKQHSSDDNVKSASSHANGVGNAGAAFSKLPGCAAAADGFIGILTPNENA